MTSSQTSPTDTDGTDEKTVAVAARAIHAATQWQYDYCCDGQSDATCQAMAASVAQAVTSQLLSPFPVVALSQGAVSAATAALHRGFLAENGSCDHGTRTGGPSHGQPYAMCEILAGRVAEAIAYSVMVVAPTAPSVESLTAAIAALPVEDMRCSNKQMDGPDPVCGKHGWLWEEGKTRCNHYGAEIAGLLDAVDALQVAAGQLQ